ncbi:hypothetical protein [Prevotella histicola]|uniref:hypothetical protein n=1 Tax=Prevotella histicola TaxID=470565 RepID=UPI0028EC23CC|nr:hypothetical protein [Prevotella histicola]
MNKVLYFFLTLLIYYFVLVTLVTLSSFPNTGHHFLLKDISNIFFSGLISNICGYVLYKKKYEKRYDLVLQKYSNDHFLFMACQLMGMLAIGTFLWLFLFGAGITDGTTYQSILAICLFVFFFLPSPLKIVRAKQHNYYNKHVNDDTEHKD